MRRNFFFFFCFCFSWSCDVDILSIIQISYCNLQILNSKVISLESGNQTKACLYIFTIDAMFTVMSCNVMTSQLLVVVRQARGNLNKNAFQQDACHPLQQPSLLPYTTPAMHAPLLPCMPSAKHVHCHACPPVDRQTLVKILPSQTSFAGGKKVTSALGSLL